jgi:DNA-binding NarL/FixJ family response regulator
MSGLRILVADESEFVRRKLRSVLLTEPKWHVAAEATTKAELLAKVKELRPHIVVLDIAEPALGGLEAAQVVHELFPDTKVIALSAQEEEGLLRGALQAGVSGYVMKSDLKRKILAAVRAASSGLHFFDTQVSKIVKEGYLERSVGRIGIPPKLFRLTARELEIVRLLAMGHGNRYVAAKLGIRLRTVETHRANIMRKLNVHTIAELIHFAVAKRIIHIDSHPSVPTSKNHAIA